MTEVVMYVPDDTGKLKRFVFEANEFEEIGEMTNQNGELMKDIEAFAFIPYGIHKGFYGSGASGAPDGSQYRLARIDPMTAAVTVYDIGGSAEPLNYPRGMTAHQFVPDELFAGESGGWRLLGIRTKANNTECYLAVVDPADGEMINVPGQASHGLPIRHDDPQDPGPPQFVQMEGVAVDANGEYFGVSYHPVTKKSRLWHIDVSWSAATANAVPLNGYSMPDRIESLEFAYGVTQLDPAGLPGAAGSWSHANGVLLGFSDDEDSLVVMNADLASPNVGAWEYLDTLYGEQIAFMAVDAEGIVFTTREFDPNEPLRNPFD